MPFIPAAAAPAAISGIAGIIQGGLGAFAQHRANRQNRAWALEDYQMQKKDAREFWNLQNEYNSPQAQMERLEAAGLSKVMMYGQNQSVQGRAEKIQTPDIRRSEYRDPIGNIIDRSVDTIAKFQDHRVRQAQTDLLRTQAEAADSKILLQNAQTLGQNILAAKNSAELAEWNTEFFRERRKELAAGRADLVWADSRLRDQLHGHLAHMHPKQREHIIASINYIKSQDSYKQYLTTILKAMGPYGPIVKQVAGAIIAGIGGVAVSRFAARKISQLPRKKILPVDSIIKRSTIR